MVSLPDFDPNLRRMTAGDSQRNIMAQDVYELGSIFKVFSFALGLEDKTFRPDDVLPIPAGFRIGKHEIHEAHHMPSAMAARDILAQSSNIGTSQIALRSGGVRQSEFLRALGLLTPVSSDLPEKAYPLYPKRQWGAIETVTVGFGQGISVSPLSFTAALATVVNGGRRITPTFIRQDAGTIEVLGFDPVTENARVRERIGVMLQGGGGYPAARTGEMLNLVAAYAARPLDPAWLLDTLGLTDVARTTWLTS
jgi:cell division protein FtsI/penicillin-binding protein 2